MGESVMLENMIDATDCSTSMVPEYTMLERLNGVFEYIGVLTFDTDVKEDKRAENEMADCIEEEESVNLPSSKVNTYFMCHVFHCLVHIKLSVNDTILISPTTELIPDLLRRIRKSMLRHVTVVLGDDELAANFMLLHLSSKVC
ncbi:minichromosome maintenance complex-binding protein [Tanacetum coccineum]